MKVGWAIGQIELKNPEVEENIAQTIILKTLGKKHTYKNSCWDTC